MGKGKGNPEDWVAVVRPGRVMYELEGVTETLAREAFHLAEHKLAVQTRVLLAGDDAMKGVRAKDLRGNQADELQRTAAKLQNDLFQHRLKQSTNQLENTMLIRNTRRELARVHTVLSERLRQEKAGKPAQGAKTAQRLRRRSKPWPLNQQSCVRQAGREGPASAKTPAAEGASSAEERETSRKRKLVGVVTSDKMNKTVVVLVERRVSHGKYGKYVRKRDQLQGARRDEPVQGRRPRRDRRVAAALARQALARRRSSSSAAGSRLERRSADMIQTTTTLDVADNSGAKK